MKEYFVLEQLRTQKLDRARKREGYGVLLQKMHKTKALQFKENPSPHLHQPIIAHSPRINTDEQITALKKQNKELKQKLQGLQQQQKQKMEKFYLDFDAAKDLYAQKIKQIVLEIRKTKSYYVAKLQQVRSQLEAANAKNQLFSSQTKTLEVEIEERRVKMKSYQAEIQKEYGDKLNQFEKIYNKSCGKMSQQVQRQRIKDEELVESTLKSDELMEQIMDNLEQGKARVQQNYQDYSQLLKTKQDIVEQLLNGNERKMKQIENLKTIQEKMTLIFEKLREEKQIYIEQNNSMGEELIQVKTVLQAAMVS